LILNLFIIGIFGEYRMTGLLCSTIDCIYGYDIALPNQYYKI
jgi:hypothetical protein